MDGVRADATAAVRYVGQSYELAVPLGLSDATAAAIGDAFQIQHDLVYGYANRGLPVEVLGLRVTHRRASVTPLLVPISVGNGQPFAERLALFAGQTEPVTTPIFWRGDLSADQLIRGPAVIEQEDATTVVYPGQRAVRRPSGGLFVEREDSR